MSNPPGAPLPANGGLDELMGYISKGNGAQAYLEAESSGGKEGGSSEDGSFAPPPPGGGGGELGLPPLSPAALPAPAPLAPARRARSLLVLVKS